jgi:hypothetical protein
MDSQVTHANNETLAIPTIILYFANFFCHAGMMCFDKELHGNGVWEYLGNSLWSWGSVSGFGVFTQLDVRTGDHR